MLHRDIGRNLSNVLAPFSLGMNARKAELVLPYFNAPLGFHDHFEQIDFDNLRAYFYEVDIEAIRAQSPVILHIVNYLFDFLQHDHLLQGVVVFGFYGVGHQIKELGVFNYWLVCVQVLKILGRFSFNIIKIVDYLVLGSDLTHRVEISPGNGLFMKKTSILVSVFQLLTTRFSSPPLSFLPACIMEI